jgi:hypothetical protein
MSRQPKSFLPLLAAAALIVAIVMSGCGTTAPPEPAASQPDEGAPVGSLTVEWQQDGQCRQASLDRNENVRYGACGGNMTTLQLGEAATEASDELAAFVDQYAAFNAETAAGSVRFGGQGSQVATVAEQRMLAEWARWLAREAEAGEATISDGVVFTWHRLGGDEAACDIVSLYATGIVETRSCHKEPPQLLSRTRLSAGQLEQLYAWADGLAAFDADGATTDATGATIRLTFAGSGEAQASQMDRQAMTGLAAELFAAAAPASSQ